MMVGEDKNDRKTKKQTNKQTKTKTTNKNKNKKPRLLSSSYFAFIGNIIITLWPP